LSSLDKHLLTASGAVYICYPESQHGRGFISCLCQLKNRYDKKFKTQRQKWLLQQKDSCLDLLIQIWTFFRQHNYCCFYQVCRLFNVKWRTCVCFWCQCRCHCTLHFSLAYRKTQRLTAHWLCFARILTSLQTDTEKATSPAVVFVNVSLTAGDKETVVLTLRTLRTLTMSTTS